MKMRYLAILGLALVTGASQAALTVYSGIDIGANSTDPRPNSDAAAAAFDAATGPNGLINFENQPLGQFASLNVAPGITMTGSDFNSANQNILNSPVGSPDGIFGYNTTTGGTQWASLFGGTITFTFTTPVSYFGAYFTGVQQFLPCSIDFSDGSSQSIPMTASVGGVQFLGFTDTGASITSITINGSNDIIGMDDVRYMPGAVPEPASMTALGIGALALIRRRRQNKA